MNILKNKGEFYELINKNELVLFQFGSQNCSPCKSIKAKIEDFELNNENVCCYYVPVEKFQSLSASLTIFTVPTILVYVKGKLAINKSGFFSLEEIFLGIEKYLLILNSIELDYSLINKK